MVVEDLEGIDPAIMAKIISFHKENQQPNQSLFVNKLTEHDLNRYIDILKQTGLIKWSYFSKERFKVTKEGQRFLRRHEIIKTLH